MIDSPDDLELQDMYDQLPALRDAVIENHNSGRGIIDFIYSTHLMKLVVYERRLSFYYKFKPFF